MIEAQRDPEEASLLFRRRLESLLLATDFLSAGYLLVIPVFLTIL